MPLAQKNKGYTHWNPSSPEKFYAVSNIPRMFSSITNARRSITNWFKRTKTPWGSIRQPIEDNRKKEDLEIIEVELVLKEPSNAT